MTPEQRQALVAAAQAWSAARVPYVSGGMTRAGADCSGSVSAIYAEAGMPIGHLFSGDFRRDARFRQVAGPPEVGDVGWYPGHVVIFGGETGPNKDVWSASHTGGPVFGPGLSRWYGSPTWYRYVGP